MKESTVKIVEDLEEYLELQYDEVTEACYKMIELLYYLPHISENLYVTLEKELESQLEDYKQNWKIVEEEIIVPEKRHIEKSLVEVV